MSFGSPAPAAQNFGGAQQSSPSQNFGGAQQSSPSQNFGGASSAPASGGNQFQEAEAQLNFLR